MDTWRSNDQTEREANPGLTVPTRPARAENRFSVAPPAISRAGLTQSSTNYGIQTVVAKRRSGCRSRTIGKNCARPPRSSDILSTSELMPKAESTTNEHERDRLDRARFAAQFEAVYARLWIVAASILGDQTGADDIVQESAMTAWSKRDQFTIGTNFGAWLVRFVRWHSFNYTRKRAGRNTHPTDPADLDLAWSTPPVPESSLESARAGELLDDQPHFDDEVVRALRSVPPVSRACLLLRTVHELSYREISELLDIPEGTAMSHVHRTRSILRDRLRPPFRDSSAGAP